MPALERDIPRLEAMMEALISYQMLQMRKLMMTLSSIGREAAAIGSAIVVLERQIGRMLTLVDDPTAAVRV